MGFLDRIVGSREEQFARRVLSVVRRAGMAEAWYDPDQFAIGYRRPPDDGREKGWIYLANVYRECAGVSRAERDERVSRLVTSVVAAPELPETWEQVRPHLRPVLRAATFGLGAPPGAKAPLRRPVLPYLAEMVVIDLPNSMAYVTVEQVQRWGVDAEQVYASARANLAATAGFGDEQEATGPAVLRFVDTGDAYFVSMLLLDGWLAALAGRVGGRPVAFVPDQNTLIVAADQPEALPALFELVEKEYTEAVRGLSPQAYTVDGDGRVVPYPTHDQHPLLRQTRRADAILAATEYGAQSHWLNQDHERDGVDIYVGNVVVLQADDGAIATVASWAAGVDTLLPVAQYVGFGTGQEKPFFVPWHVVMSEVELPAVPGLLPTRYRAVNWPPPPAMDRLRAQAVEL